MDTIVTRLFRLKRDLAWRRRFDEVGEENLLTSVEREPGTLAMYATHVPDDPATCYVFEAYADESAYQAHAASPHFRAYVDMASQALEDREVIRMTPRLLLEKPGPLRVHGGSAVEPHLVFVDVRPGGEASFLQAAEANMRATIATEPGVLVMYAATLVDDPSRWAFWEVYASADAYRKHRETEHFKAYLAATEASVADKEPIVLVADTLVSKGGLRHPS